MVIEWQTFSGSRYLAKYCTDSSSECSLTFNFYVQVVDIGGRLVTASGNPQSLVLCILDVSVVCVA